MPRARPEDLILNLESSYSQLRERNQDRDEHWLLANTWLARYGSSDQAKEQGAAWANFVAYKDTLQFSILDTPRSIRALALFLFYKEWGERAAARYADEYAQLYEKIYTSMNNGTFIHEYRKKNPQTWNDNAVDDGSSYNLYWLLRGMEFRGEHPEEAEKVLGQMNLGDE